MSFDELAREIAGMPFIVSERIDPGQIIVGTDLGTVDARGVGIVMMIHPLDRIALEHPNPLDRLEVAMAWIVASAHRKLDALSRRIARGDYLDRPERTPE